MYANRGELHPRLLLVARSLAPCAAQFANQLMGFTSTIAHGTPRSRLQQAPLQMILPTRHRVQGVLQSARTARTAAATPAPARAAPAVPPLLGTIASGTPVAVIMPVAAPTAAQPLAAPVAGVAVAPRPLVKMKISSCRPCGFIVSSLPVGLMAFVTLWRPCSTSVLSVHRSGQVFHSPCLSRELFLSPLSRSPRWLPLLWPVPPSGESAF
jgi:hypothetical protein